MAWLTRTHGSQSQIGHKFPVSEKKELPKLLIPKPTSKYSQKLHITFDRDELALGTLVEMEHTDDPVVARKIAMEHLMDIPDYYSRLRKHGMLAGIEIPEEDEELPETERIQRSIARTRQLIEEAKEAGAAPTEEELLSHRLGISARKARKLIADKRRAEELEDIEPAVPAAEERVVKYPASLRGPSYQRYLAKLRARRAWKGRVREVSPAALVKSTRFIRTPGPFAKRRVE